MTPIPSLQELEAARRKFEEKEPRDLFYRAATELVELAIQKNTSLTIAEALAVLLQTWNRTYYQFRGFEKQHYHDIERLIEDNWQLLEQFRGCTLEEFKGEDKEEVKTLFHNFELILGPVGAAKCLHLLSPRFFPLWDRAITQAYKLYLDRIGTNSERYYRFILITQEQVKQLGGEAILLRNPLKAIDEYNYCRFSKRWL